MSSLGFLLGVYVALLICSIFQQLGLNSQSCFPLNIHLSQVRKRFIQKTFAALKVRDKHIIST